MKHDEQQLLDAFRANGAYNANSRDSANGRESAREVGARLGIHPNRVAYLCQKWTDRGWYDYGVCVDLGWMTPEGMEATAAIVGGAV